MIDQIAQDEWIDERERRAHDEEHKEKQKEPGVRANVPQEPAELASDSVGHGVAPPVDSSDASVIHPGRQVSL